ncbi:hypothetical protein CDAR_522851 [Caerostris darwini]|uniref:Uncharacterized protein n=1 Tax=Caerostris darwini TaxID=1538125 RepID=A0AAV4VC54_9ARAC|nr:hypothetical protein CDAR_522851 [Caerostris darwini]
MHQITKQLPLHFHPLRNFLQPNFEHTCHMLTLFWRNLVQINSQQEEKENRQTTLQDTGIAISRHMMDGVPIATHLPHVNPVLAQSGPNKQPTRRKRIANQHYKTLTFAISKYKMNEVSIPYKCSNAQ